MENDNITIPLKELERRFKEVYLRLPRLAGNVIVNFSLDNFKRQGFLGDSFQPWRPRKVINKWGKKTKRPGRAILVMSGILRRGTRVIRANTNEVVVGNNVPYAKVHNDGLKDWQIQQVKESTRRISTVSKIGTLKSSQPVAAHTRTIIQNIPARPFLKDSPYLRRNLQKAIAAEILKALK